MKGISIYIIVFFALVCCSIVSSSSGLGEINRVNVTMSVYLESNFPKFSAAFQSRNPDLWLEIANAPADLANTYTVFAVNDTYFNASHVTNATAATFEYHVHGPGPVAVFSSPPSLNFTTLDTLYRPPTLDGQKQVLSFSIANETKVLDTFINKNKNQFVVEYNLLATNGIIQSVSGVIDIPSQNVAEVLPASSFSILASLVNAVKFPATANYLTLLAPVDSAFDVLFNDQPMGPIYKAYFESNLTSVADSIRAVLTNHVLNRTFYPETLQTGTTTFYTISNPATPTYVNYENGVVRILETLTGHEVSQVVVPNYIADNGVSHGISQVLIPSGFGLPLSDLLHLLNASDFLAALNRTDLLSDSVARTYFVPTNNVSNIGNFNETQVRYYIADTASVSFDNEFAPTLLNLSSLDSGLQHLFLDTQHQNVTNGTYTYTRVNTVKVVSPAYTTVRGSKVYLIGDALPVPQLASATLKDNKDTSDFVGLYTERELAGNGLYNIDTNLTTLFVPTNEAFGKVPLGYVGFLRVNSSRSIDVAQRILNNHAAVRQALYQIPSNAVSVYQSANNGNPITVNSTALANGSQTIHVNNDETAVQPIPTLTANGVIYYIDGLIVPADVKFTATDVLEGLAQENMANNNYGDYSTQLEHYEQTGLTNELLESTAPFTLFAYSNAAWENSATSFPRGDLNSSSDAGKFEELRSLLEYGVVYGESVEDLNQTNILVPGNRTNATIEVTRAGPGEKTQVTLRTQDGKTYTANVIVATNTSYGQTIYGLDRVLGAEAREESSGKKLPTWALVLIIVGGIIIGLIILAVIVAAVWYLFIRPNREGYRALN